MANIVAIITTAFITGILLIDACQLPLNILYAATVITLVAIFMSSHCPKVLIALAAVLFLLCGAVRYLHATEIPASDISYLAGQGLTVYGKLADVPQVTPLDGGQVKVKYKITAESVIIDQKQLTVTGNVLVYTQQGMSKSIAGYGDRIAINGKLVLPHSYGNPGMIDTAASLKRQGITARINTKAEQIFFKSSKTDSWQDSIAEWRSKVLLSMGKVMTPAVSSILSGMLFGGYTGISRDIVNSFAATGIVHILSVSGTHIALVAGVVIWIGTRLGIRRQITMSVAVVCIVLYSLVAGLTPPVVRSVLMGIICIAAVVLGREKDAPTALMITGLAMLIYQPDLIFDISFQLSFSAAAGLIFLYSQTVKALRMFPPWLAGPLAVTISAQLGVLPFLAWYFNNFSLSSFIANIILVPIIEATVVLGLAAAVLETVFLPESFLWTICAQLIYFVVKVNGFIAAIPGSNIYLPPMNFWIGILYYLLLAWIYGYKPTFVPTPVICMQRWPIVSRRAILLILIIAVVYFYYPRSVSVHFIDVGQGDATLITTPHRRAILIDSGGTVGLNSSDFDVGERVVLPYLRHYGILELDYLILTHNHQDHAGGSAGISSNLPVKNVMIIRDYFTPAVEKLMNVKGNSRIIPIYKDQRITIDGVDINVIHDGINFEKQHTSNEVSCVIKASYGNHSFLVTGDLESKAELVIIDAKEEVASTVLKVGHHGANTSTTAEFLRAIRPQYAVISVGYNNRFGHPKAEVLKRLSEQDIKVFRTDENGAVVFKTDGKVLSCDTFKSK